MQCWTRAAVLFFSLLSLGTVVLSHLSQTLSNVWMLVYRYVGLLYTYLDINMYVCMYACMHVCMDVCMYVCLYVCMYVCIFIFISIYMLHAFPYDSVCVRTPIYIHICKYVCKHMEKPSDITKTRIAYVHTYGMMKFPIWWESHKIPWFQSPPTSIY